MSEENRFQKIVGKVEDIARDLMSLEVNTIIQDQIHGNKMPSTRHALIDISKEFRNKLSEMGYSMEAEIMPFKQETGVSLSSMNIQSDNELKQFSSGELHGYSGFALIREQAKCAAKDMDQKEQMTVSDTEQPHLGAKKLMLERIMTMSDNIKGILDQNRVPFTRDQCMAMDNGQTPDPPLPDLKLNTQQVTMLRKIWEIRTSVIAMQTVISLDGDVINRIIPEVLHDPDRQKIIIQLHDSGVKTSINFWKDLVNLVKDFFGAFVSSKS